MHDYQRQFIELALQFEALKFGEFTLKSGRNSPYFFNAGAFNNGEALLRLGNCYAAAIVASNLEFDVIFGPAYKGIPLATATATALAAQHGRSVPWCFNRKERKAHGEGGELVGAELAGRVLVVDDVITAGTAIREAAEIILANGATPGGVMIALDRQERGAGGGSAVQEIAEELSIKVFSIVRLADLMHYLEGQPEMNETLQAVRQYQQAHGTGGV